MDMYIILCFFAVFAALVEFACINFVDTFIKRFKVWEAEQKAKISENEVEVNGKEEKEAIVQSGDAGNGEVEVVILIPAESERRVSVMQQQPPLARSECGVSTVSTQDACVSTEDEDFEDLQEAEEESQPGCPLLSRLAEQAVDRVFERMFRKGPFKNIESLYLWDIKQIACQNVQIRDIVDRPAVLPYHPAAGDLQRHPGGDLQHRQLGPHPFPSRVRSLAGRLLDCISLRIVTHIFFWEEI